MRYLETIENKLIKENYQPYIKSVIADLDSRSATENSDILKKIYLKINNLYPDKTYNEIQEFVGGLHVGFALAQDLVEKNGN